MGDNWRETEACLGNGEKGAQPQLCTGIPSYTYSEEIQQRQDPHLFFEK